MWRRSIAAVAAGFMGAAITACGGGSVSAGGTVDSGSSSGGGSVQVEKPSITTQPVSQSVVAGQTATFSVVAASSGTLAYQWKKNGTTITGATSSSYTTSATSSADNGAKFSVVVANGADTVTSNDATLTVSATAVAPAITKPPENQSVTAGQTASFSVSASGTSPFGYQWKKNGTNISGATASTYTTPATSSADNGALYSVVVFNGAGTVTSSNATLTVTAAGVIDPRFSLVAKASGGTYDKTECVKDNSTGLVWEGKTASPATSRLGTSYYTNYDSTSSAQKWNGTNPTQTEIDAITNSIGYKNSVNTSALCGYTDWRMPTKEELQGILASSGIPKIDTTWFPNTRASFYWSSSPYVGNSSYAWYVYFGDGGVDVSGYLRVSISRVRLVR